MIQDQLVYPGKPNDPRSFPGLGRLDPRTGAIEPWQAEGMPPVGFARLVLGSLIRISEAAKAGVGVVDAPVRSIFGNGAIAPLPTASGIPTGAVRAKLAATGMVNAYDVIDKRPALGSDMLSGRIGLVP